MNQIIEKKFKGTMKILNLVNGGRLDNTRWKVFEAGGMYPLGWRVLQGRDAAMGQAGQRCTQLQQCNTCEWRFSVLLPG